MIMIKQGFCKWLWMSQPWGWDSEDKHAPNVRDC